MLSVWIIILIIILIEVFENFARETEKKIGNYFGAEYFSPRTLYSFKKTITCQVLVEVINIIYTDAKLDTGLKSTVRHRLALPPHSLECCSCEEGARCRTIKVIYSTLTFPHLFILYVAVLSSLVSSFGR